MGIVLASSSPRRLELLKRITENFIVIPSNFDEDTIKFQGDFGKYVVELSENKALSVFSKIAEPSIIIGSDTIVAIEGEVLGKPKDRDDAIRMLKKLSGKIHYVYTGVTVLNTVSNKTVKDFVKTSVKFSKLDDAQICKYVDSGEPYGKAGAYAIQGYAGVFVEEIHGCFFNIVGLPLNKLKNMLGEMGINL